MWLQERTKTSPHTLALIYGKVRWSYGELNQQTNGLMAYLMAQGIRPGERVAVLLPSSPLYVCLVHALAQMGVVLVPLNGRLTPPELIWQIESVGCHWLLAAEKMASVNCPTLIINDQLLEPTSTHTPPPISQPSSSALQSILFTSGTSGRPKAVPLTFDNHFYSAMSSAYRLGLLPHDLWLSCLPLYHVGGLAVLFRSCLYGTAVDLHARFDLEAINHSLDTNPITLISVVPTMLYRLLQQRSQWPASLRLILLGGAAADPNLIAQANSLSRWPQFAPMPQPIVAPTYGLTEASSQVATMLPEMAAKKPGSVGRPLLFTTVQIVNEQGSSCKPNEMGEVVVAGPTVMGGYLGQAQPASSHSQTGFATGDMGYLDEDGDLWIVQRRSDLIVSGGENVYPAEVEQVIGGHGAVTAVAVVGVPHPEWGQQVAAAVVTRPQAELTAEQLITFCRERLAGYKIPRQIRFVAELPQTASGKIARTAVSELFST